MTRGDSDGDSQYVSRSGVRLLRALTAIEQKMEDFSLEGVCIKELRLRGPEATGATYQIVVKAVDEARNPLIGFGGADSLIDAIVRLADIMGGVGLRLQAEIPYEDRLRAAGKKSKKA
jgi:hypothetical protein